MPISTSCADSASVAADTASGAAGQLPLAAGRQDGCPAPQSGAGHFRRFHGYDYSRGASLFITFNVEPKEDILGHIEPPGVLVHNEWGRLVDAKVADRAVYARIEGGRLRW